MKKLRDVVITLVSSVILTSLILFVYDSYLNIQEQKEIKESIPTAQEQAQFQTLLDDNTYYYYNQLSDKDKQAYSAIYSALLNFDESVFVALDESRIKDVYAAVIYDNPRIFWIERNFTYIVNDNSIEFKPQYRFNELEAENLSIRIDRKVEKIIAEANTYPTEYEKELYIHDYICMNTTYDDTVDGDSIYDVFIKGKAVCEGYAKAVQLLLDELDIDNYLISGDGISENNPGPHMWNIVNINNMNYHLDATWNDNDDTNEITYFYFNISDSTIKTDHINLSPENNFCVTDDANYYNVNNAYYDSFNGFDEHIERSAELLRNGENHVEFVFKKDDDYNRAINDIENDNGLFSYMRSALKKSGRKADMTQMSYILIEEHNYLCIVFKEE